MIKGTGRVLATVITLAMLAAACGGGDGTDAAAGGGSSDAPPENAAAGGDDAEPEAATEAATSDDGSAASGGGGGSEVPEEGVYADHIDYGFIYDQTGPTASTQTVFFDGFESHIEAVNADGGVSGRTINILEEDEKYDVPTGVAAYTKLVNQTPVVGMTGLNNSSLQGAVIEDVDPNAVPVIGAESTNKAAVNPFREYFFAMECTYADQADVAVAYSTTLADGEAPRTATIFGNVASGEEYAGLIQERVEAAGGEYLGSVSVEYGSTEADAQAQQIAAMDPDVIHLHGGVSIGIPVLASLEKFGVTAPVVGIFAMHNNEVPTSAPSVPFSAVNCYANGYDDIDGAEPLIAEAEANGISQEVYERPEFVNGWVVANVLVEALTQAGDELTRESLADAVAAIEDFSVGALSPAVTFGPDDRIGVASVKPFEFDPDSARYTAVGEFADYSDCLTNEYITDELGDYDPAGCIGG